MKKLEYKGLKEEMYYEKLENGLDVYLLPKNNYNKTFATFSTRFGSVDNMFIVNGKEVNVIDGIAHFLEHKLFEMPDGNDASNRLSFLGANANAFTTYNQTTYLFSATSNVKESLEVLLDFVQQPHFTDENVSKEKGIIEQEIRMYDDYPEFVSEVGLLKNLFLNHPVRIDVAGDVESINKITKEDLYECYNTFYHPSNMQLFVIGNFNLDEIHDLIVSNQNNKKFEPKMDIKRIYPKEELKVNKDYEEKKMDVSIPKLCYGIKIIDSSDPIKLEMIISIYLMLLFGETSINYEKFLKEELINETFDASCLIYNTFKMIIVSTDTANPKKLIQHLNEALLGKKKFSEEDFLRTKKGLIGKFVAIFDSLEAVSNLFTRYLFIDSDLFSIIDVIEKITLEDVLKIDNLIDTNAISSFVVLPK